MVWFTVLSRHGPPIVRSGRFKSDTTKLAAAPEWAVAEADNRTVWFPSERALVSVLTLNVVLNL